VTTPKFTLRYGHNQPTATSQHKAIEVFKKLVEERSKGAIQIQIFPQGQLGTLAQQTEAVGLGTLDFTQQPSSVATVYDPALVALDLPYLFPVEDVALKVLNGPLGDSLMSGLQAKGIRGLGLWAAGFNQITTGNKAVHTPDDLKGLKMRVLPSPVLTATFKVWGASPTNIDYSQLYTALQQKVVDGEENPLFTLAQIKLFEVQKFVSLTNHRLFVYTTLMSKKTHDSLPADLQQVVVQADRDALVEYVKLIHQEDADARKTVEDKGMTVVTLKPEEIDAFRKASQPVYSQFADQIGPDLLKQLQAAGSASS